MAFEKVLLNGGLLLFTMIVLSTAIKNNFTINSYQPNYIKPLHYDIKIRLYVKRNIFIGEYNSTIRIDRKTSNITMQLLTFGIHKIFLIDKNERIHKPKYVVYKNHTINFDFGKRPQYGKFELLPDTYILKMTYVRTIFDQENFNQYYVGANGEQVMAATGVKIIQQLFPWPTTIPSKLDKETLKASFNISILHHQNYTILSNMPVLAKYEDKNYMMWTCFEQLPYMFARHLTIVATTFSNIATLSPNIKFWCRQNMTELVQIARNNVEHVAQYLMEKNLMKVPKMDYVVIKDSDHNDDVTWRLILQRDTHIIYNENLDSAMRKIQIAHYIARQMASLWHADAILWSKNSFTTFFGAHILDQIQQNDDMMDLIVIQTQEFLRFLTPSYVNPLPSISTNVTEDKLLSSSLHYMKSFAMWRLLHLIFDDMFWTGIRKYIDIYNDSDTTNAYDNLWTIMQSTINSRNSEYKLNIKNIIDTWTTKTYYPVLNVRRDYINDAVEIVCVKSIDMIDNDTENWIPVTYTTKSSLNFTNANNLFWLNSYNRSYRIEGIDRNDWIILNIQQIGYYRVNYDLENWKKLANYLNYTNTKIHVLNRAQIIDDAYHFLLQKQISYKMFWNLTSFLTQDTDYVAWYPMIKAFEHIMCIFPTGYGKDVRENMIRILKALITNIGYYKRLGDNDLIECLREEMIKWACIFDISNCRQIANNKLKDELNFQQQTDLSLKEWIYCKGSIMADDETLYSLWSLWLKTVDIRILEFMACSKNSIFIYDHLLYDNMTNIPDYDIKKSEKLKTEFKANKQAYIFLFIVAKHAKNDITFTILRNLNHFKSKVIDTIATLIVIITHINSVKDLEQVVETFVKFHHPQENLFRAIRKKVKKRKWEYLKLIKNYRLLI